MAEILLSSLADALGGPVVADATFTATATRARAVGDGVVANKTITVSLTAGVPSEPILLDQSGVDWCWRVRVVFPSIGVRIDRTVAVPDVPSVEWADLVDVDPATLLPAESAVPAWTAAVGQVAGLLADTVVARNAATTAQGLSEDARDAAELARGIAEGARDGAVVARGASEAARDQAQVYAANTVELQDTTFTALIADEESATRTQLNATFVADTSAGLDRLSASRSDVLLPWHAALANRHYQRADIAVLGDSITEGQGATQIDRRWIARMRDQLRARHATTGLTGGGRGFIAVATTGQTSFTHPATLAGAPSVSNGYGPKRASAKLDGAGRSVTFTVNGTACDLLYLRGTASQTVTVAVDGGAPETVNMNGSLLDGQKHRITFGSGGAHTVVVAWAAGTNYVHGVIEYNGDETKGISVHDCGHFGWNSGAGGSGWLSSTNNWPIAVASLGAALVVIALGTNDPGVVTPAEHRANLEQIIGLLRSGYASLGMTAPPVVLVPYGGKSTAAATWPDYVAEDYAIAAVDPAVTVCDLSLRVPNAASNPGNIYADVVGHPTDKGHALFGDAVANFLAAR